MLLLIWPTLGRCWCHLMELKRHVKPCLSLCLFGREWHLAQAVRAWTLFEFSKSTEIYWLQFIQWNEPRAYPLEATFSLIKFVNHVKWNANHRWSRQNPSKWVSPVGVRIFITQHVLVVQYREDQNDLKSGIAKEFFNRFSWFMKRIYLL